MAYNEKKVLFIDLNGTINKSKSGTFIKNAEDIELVEGIKEVLTAYIDAGYIICVISNQGGVAHGYRKMEDFTEEIVTTQRLLGFSFDFWYAAYAMKTGKGDFLDCDTRTRKPYIGCISLLEQYLAKEEHAKIDYENSLMVGDREEDALFAVQANLNFISASLFLVKGIENITNKVFDRSFCKYLMTSMLEIKSRLIDLMLDNKFLFKESDYKNKEDIEEADWELIHLSNLMIINGDADYEGFEDSENPEDFEKQVVELRRTGRTTRIIDYNIQQLFKGNVINSIDHSYLAEENIRLFEATLRRLELEHSSIYPHLDIDYENRVIKLKS